MKAKMNRYFLAACLVLGGVAGAAGGATAMPPPVDFALEATAEAAEARRQGSWSMTLVDGGVTTLWSESFDGEAIRFRDNGQDVEISADSEIPWLLVWAVLWSEQPQEDLRRYSGQWPESTGRVEVISGQLAFCYGDEGRLCVDSEVRRILVLEVVVEETRWELRTSREGQRLQISRDGSLTARFSGR